MQSEDLEMGGTLGHSVRGLSSGRTLRKFVVQARESAARAAALEGILQRSESPVREVDKLSRSFSGMADVE